MRIRSRVKESIHLLLFIVAKTWTIFNPVKDIWLISERGHEARDNAFVFFRYMLLNHPDIDARYVIDNESPDREKLSFAKHKLVSFNSFFHYCCLSKAKYLISTHIMGFSPDISLFTALDRHFNVFRKQRKVFLQHGIIKDDIPFLYAENVSLDLFCTGGLEEFKFIVENYHHPKGVVQYTGLARYDLLNNYSSKRMVLIMPTWRLYLDNDSFDDSEFFNRYKELLMSPILGKILDDYGYEAIFYPHYEIQKHIGSFKSLNTSSLIHIAGFEYDVQRLLKESSVLVTDYSSVYFDMAYMHKPVLFYHFDEDVFRKNHYKRGYFYESSIGPVFKDLDSLLSCLDKTLKSDCKLNEEYCAYIDSFFKYRDSNNCNRIYNCICQLS